MRTARFCAFAALMALGLLGCNGGPGGDEFSPAEAEAAAARNSPAIGRTAPSFSLPDQGGELVSLDDYAGKWVVLYFYPKNDTPGCICEATEFTELLFKFKRLNAAVVGVSEDTPASHRAFSKKHDLKITLLSDPQHDVMRRYGAWVQSRLGGEEYGRVVRTTYIVGPDGRIRYHWPEVIPQGHAERVRAKLAGLQEKSN